MIYGGLRIIAASGTRARTVVSALTRIARVGVNQTPPGPGQAAE